jgi:hypothetical protein
MELLSTKARSCSRSPSAVVVIVAAGLALNGCHKPIAQQAPSLNLPGPVRNLAAIRGDNMVWLSWTMPQRTTYGQKIKEEMTVRVCRRDTAGGDCVAAGQPILLAPGAAGSFSEMLPAEFASGKPRPFCYFLELKNGNGRSAGLINSVCTLAGSRPLPVRGLTAEIQGDTVLLRWTPVASGDESDDTAIRVFRRLVTPNPSAQNSPTLPSQSTEQKLVVEVGASSDNALDKDVRIGETYEYRSQRVVQVTVNGQKLEWAGELSPPVRIHFVKVVPSSTGP